MRRWLCGSLLLFAVLLPGARAQENAGPAPAHLGSANSSPIFALKTHSRQTQFHLGEMISIGEDYSAPVSGRYFLLSAPEALEAVYSPKASTRPKEALF